MISQEKGKIKNANRIEKKPKNNKKEQKKKEANKK
jgi:hypothetical protein